MLVAARSAASLGLDASCVARSVPFAEVPPLGDMGAGDAVRLMVCTGSSTGSTAASPVMPSSSACDKSPPTSSIERGEGRKSRKSPDGRCDSVPCLGPWDAGGLSAPDSSMSSSVSRADMERESGSPQPPSAARKAGRPSWNPFDVELCRERDRSVDGRREMVTFRFEDGRWSLEGRRDAAGDKDGRAGVGGPS